MYFPLRRSWRRSTNCQSDWSGPPAGVSTSTSPSRRAKPWTSTVCQNYFTEYKRTSTRLPASLREKLFLLTYTGCFFLNDNFETLITLSILKISSFCKVVLTNQTGTFDNQQKRSSKRYYNIHFKQLEYQVLSLQKRFNFLPKLHFGL